MTGPSNLEFGKGDYIFCLNSLLKSVDFELFLVNHDSGPKMNMCHVFQPACCSTVSLNLYIYIYTCIYLLNPWNATLLDFILFFLANRFGLDIYFQRFRLPIGPFVFTRFMEDSCNKPLSTVVNAKTN